jgi:predicted ArsR family transcriptional regulator
MILMTIINIYICRRSGETMIPANVTKPKTHVLELLRLHGPLSGRDLAQRLGVRPVSARATLRLLESAGLVTRTVEPHRASGRGRPVGRYCLTPAADALFPKQYETFAANLLDSVVAELGPEALATVLASWEDRLHAHLDTQLPRDPAARLQALAQHQSAHGFMAEVKRDEAGVTLIERNCPIATLAAKHPEICDHEAALFSRTLGWKANLVSCQAWGDGVCAFRVGRAKHSSTGAGDGPPPTESTPTERAS